MLYLLIYIVKETPQVLDKLFTTERGKENVLSITFSKKNIKQLTIPSCKGLTG
jgi:hypothetical protein